MSKKIDKEIVDGVIATLLIAVGITLQNEFGLEKKDELITKIHKAYRDLMAEANNYKVN